MLLYNNITLLYIVFTICIVITFIVITIEGFEVQNLNAKTILQF